MASPFSVRRISVPMLMMLLLLTCNASAVDPAEQDITDDLFEMDIADLMAMEVTSVTKSTGHALRSSPAAVSVITQRDIQRSGHQSIPELLRLVPGMHVGRISQSVWSISARGFNGRFNENMLVLMDGRSVYTPLFAGVLWDVQDYVIDDLERIEVIRGPGGSLWGANAVNGVINITTKDSADTQGWYFNTGLGYGDLQNSTALRYGGRLNDTATFRVYGKFDQYDDSISQATGNDYHDEWRRGSGGFRADWDTETDHLTIQGDLTSMDQHESGDSIGYQGRNAVFVWNVLGRWSHTFEDRSEIMLQGYLDFSSRKTLLNTRRYNADIEFRHTIRSIASHELVWGLNWRTTTDDVINPHPAFALVIQFPNDSDTFSQFGGYVQDTIELVPNKLNLTLGTKLDYNDWTGAEIQPTIRISYTPYDHHAFWAAVSRAVRTPSRSEDGGVLLDSVPPPMFATGNPNLDAAELLAIEWGYRFTPSSTFSVDIAGYINRYDNLIISNVPQYNNGMSAEGYGVELGVVWQPISTWRLIGSYSFHELFTHAGSEDNYEGLTPRHIASLRSEYNITDDLEFNTALYIHSDQYNPNTTVVPDSFIRVDAGLTWRPTEQLELSIWGQNLSDNQHLETVDRVFGTAGEIRRSVYSELTWRF